MTNLIDRIRNDSIMTKRLEKMPQDKREDRDYVLNWLYSSTAVSKADLFIKDNDDSLTRGERLSQWLHDEVFGKLSSHIWARDRTKLGYNIQTDLHKNPRVASNVSFEKNIARLMCRESKAGHSFKQIGKVLNFEVPLYEKKTEPYRCIDMISYCKDDDKLYLLELKKPQSQESLLRCILEAYTYIKAIKEWKSFRKEFAQDDGVDISEKTTIAIAPLAFKTSTDQQNKKSGKSVPYEDYIRLCNDGNVQYVNELLCDIKIDLQRFFGDDKNHLEFVFLSEEDPTIKRILKELRTNKPHSTISCQ